MQRKPHDVIPSRLYSPREPEAYSAICPDAGPVGIGAMLAGEDHRAIWNLYWLSDPGVDALLTDEVAALDYEMLPACFEAVKQKVGGASLAALLLRLNPPDLVARILAEDYKHLSPYILRGTRWITTITARAGAFRGVLARDNTVVHVNFARKPVS